MKIQSDLKVLGVVGIRSGSRGVPDKNIRPLAGKPLIGWILGEAKKSRYINRLVVSTDSPEYAEVGKALKLVDGGNGEQRLVSYMTGKSRDANPTVRQSYEKAYFRANVVACRT